MKLFKNKFVVLLIILLTIIISVFSFINIYNKKTSVSNKAFEPKLNDNYIYSLTDHPVFDKAFGAGAIGAVAKPLFARSFDLLLVGVRVKVDNTRFTQAIDFCLQFSSNNPNFKYLGVIGGYSEKLCFNMRPKYSQNSYDKYINLMNTPLYVPKGVAVTPMLAAFNTRKNHGRDMPVLITLKYKKYNPGEKKFTTLRFPYFDEGLSKQGTINPSYYMSTRAFPLRVRGFFVFNSFDSGQSTECLRWYKQGGQIIKQKCVYESARGAHSNRTQVIPVNWNIPSGWQYLLGAYCKNTNFNGSPSGGDCAMWALVEVPNNLNDGRAVLRDWGNIPRSFYMNYCKSRHYGMGFLWHPFFCDWKQNNKCSHEYRINTCINKGYPLANECKQNNKPVYNLTYNVLRTATPNRLGLVKISWKSDPSIREYAIRFNWLGDKWDPSHISQYRYDVINNSYRYNYIILPYKWFRNAPQHKYGIFWIHTANNCYKYSKPKGIAIQQ